MAAIPRRREMQALVTRPRAEAAELAAALAARGIAAVIEPLIEIRYRDGPAPDFAGIQAILCTSGNGVRALARASGERGVKLFAVGDATAERARAAGFLAVESAGGAAGDLARLVRRRLYPERGRVLHVCGAAGGDGLAEDLIVAGFAVERAVLYEALPEAALGAEAVAALAAGAIDLALFFSPRTAAIFADLATAVGVAGALETVAAVSISAAADAALGGLAFRERTVAASPTQAAMLDRVDRLLAAVVATR